MGLWKELVTDPRLHAVRVLVSFVVGVWSCLVLLLGCASRPAAAPAPAISVRTNVAKSSAAVVLSAPLPVPSQVVQGTDAAPHPQGKLHDAPPSKPGACPKPARKIQQLFANAFEIASRSAEKEPQRAIAEAIRLRLDELYQSGCGGRLTGKQLNQQVSLISEDPSHRENFGVLLAAGYPVASYY
ncbi:MAG: hypothetical protein KC492_46470, partial [Myxococcales bacterium]|nr:hypothetical protein [Myxococcales bacterium]